MPNKNPDEVAQRLLAHVNEAILETGLFVQHVQASITHGSYAYTIGRTLAGRPELVFSGPWSAKDANDHLRAFALADEAEPFKHHQRQDAGHFTGLFPVKVDPFGAELFTAIAVFGRVEALQLIWPDGNGRYPGDEEYAGDEQAILA